MNRRHHKKPWSAAEAQVLADSINAGESPEICASRFPDRSYDAVRVKRSAAIREGKARPRDTTEPPARVDPTHSEIMRLEARNRQLDQDLRDSRKKLGAAMDEGMLFTLLADVIRQETKPLDVRPAPRPVARKSDVVEEDLVAVFSDAHGDKVVLPERVLGFENYNWRVFCARFETWIDAILNWTQLHLIGHRFPRLWLFCLGDNLEGGIHNAEKHTVFQNAMKGALAIGDVLAAGVSDLAATFPEIALVFVPGNHPRFAKRVDWQGAHENFDFLVATQVATRLANYIDKGRVTVHAPDSYQAAVQIRGWNFLLSHGHDIKGWAGIPWYGIERKTRRMQALFSQSEHPLHYCVFGHFHVQTSLSTPAGENFVNGSWLATDEYVLDTLGAAQAPQQLLFGVHEKRGVSWRLPIQLRPRGGDDLNRDPRYGQRVLSDVGAADRMAKAGIPVIRAG